MNPSMSPVLAIEITPCSPTRWTANYYPTADTADGRQVEVTTALHQQPLPAADRLQGPTRWMEASTADPSAPVYSAFPVWGVELAAGYAAALAAHGTEAIDEHSPRHDSEALRDAAILVHPEQLKEWLLTDLLDLDATHG